MYGKIDTTNFVNQTDDDKEIEKNSKNIYVWWHYLNVIYIQLISIYSIVSNVDIRLRFDLSPAQLILNSYDNVDYIHTLYIVLSCERKK